jgi:hypothetical protein
MSAGWPIIGNYTFVHLEFNCLYRFFTISSSTSHCSTLYVASLYQNSCFRSWLIAAKVRRSAAGAYACSIPCRKSLGAVSTYAPSRRGRHGDSRRRWTFDRKRARQRPRRCRSSSFASTFTFIDSIVQCCSRKILFGGCSPPLSSSSSSSLPL